MTWTSYDIILSLMCWKLIMETSLQFGGSICLPRVRLSQPLRGFWLSLYGSAWDGWPFGSCHCCGQLSRSLFRGGRNGVLGVWHVERMTFFYQTKTKMPKVFKGLIDYIYINIYVLYRILHDVQVGDMPTWLFLSAVSLSICSLFQLKGVWVETVRCALAVCILGL